jgi:AAA domain, putative AbiEii toxin, Type IV TA system
MFTEFSAEGLKGVGQVQLKFLRDQRVYTLFGSNGVGKTKCLEALYEYLILGNKEFVSEQSALPPDFAVMKSASSNAGFIFQTPIGTSWANLESFWRAAEGVYRHELPILLLGARNRSALRSAAQTGHVGTVPLLGSFSERRKKRMGEIASALKDRQLGTLGMTDDVQSWFVARAQSNNPYQRGGDNRKIEIEAVLEMLNAVDDRIDSQFLEVDGAGNVSIKVEQQLRQLAELSSGFTSLVKLVQAIVAGYADFTNETNLRRVRGIVLIDEIESHLHAQWQTTIVKKLKAMLPNTTFFIATHSPLVLSQLDEGEAYLLERDADGVVRTQVIEYPNRRILIDVLQSAFGVDLNRLKRDSLDEVDQSAAKKALLDLLDSDDPEERDA